jgi:multimeric flavodoxin WrbA
MKITIFNGSPRGEKGNTQVMVEAFAAGATGAGAEVETIFLADKNYRGCTGCFTCWFKTPGKCIFDDDIAEMLEKMKVSDVLIFATPVYIDNVTGLMKNFMDRLAPLVDPHIETDEGGESRHILRGRSPKIGVISNCGFPEQSQFQVLELLFRRLARNMNSEVVCEIYRSGGGILKDAPLMLKPLVSRYKKLVSRAAREVVEKGRVSDELRAELEKPLISREQYVAAANKIFDAELAKIRD